RSLVLGLESDIEHVPISVLVGHHKAVDLVHSPAKGSVQHLCRELGVARTVVGPEAACGAGGCLGSAEILAAVLGGGREVDVDATLERRDRLVKDQLPDLIQSFRLGLDLSNGLVDLSPALRSVAPLLRLVGVELSSASKALPRQSGRVHV